MNKKLLIVEDNESLSNVISDTFKDEGFDVKIAADGESGLEEAKTWQPDAILLDILMPKMDGIEMVKQLRQSEGGAEMLVVALTNSDSSEHVLELMNLGVTDYLTKSDWELNDLVNKVKQRLGV